MLSKQLLRIGHTRECFPYFRTFEDQWRLLAFDAFETSETSAYYHPIQPTRYVRNPRIPGFLGSWNSSDCTSRADLATSPLSCALTLKASRGIEQQGAGRVHLQSNMVRAAQASPDSGIVMESSTTPNYGEKRIQRNTPGLKSAIHSVYFFGHSEAIKKNII